MATPSAEKQATIPEEVQRRINRCRRQLSDVTSTLRSAASNGKKATAADADASTVSFFRGMTTTVGAMFVNAEKIWWELDAFQDENVPDVPSKSDIDQRRTRETYYYQVLGFVELLNKNEAAAQVAERVSQGAANFTFAPNETRVARNLPKISIPTFDGQLINWAHFKDTFTSLVHNDNSLAAIDKFHYLRTCLAGPALSTIQHLAIREANYELAWKALMDNYDNKRFLASAYLEQILAFKPGSRATPEFLKSYLSRVGDSISAFKLLALEREADFVLFHLAVRTLDSTTRELFEMANKGTNLPEVATLIQFVKDRQQSLILSSSGTTPTHETSSSPKFMKPPRPKNGAKTTLLAQNKSSTYNTNRSNHKAKPSFSSANPQEPPCFACKKDSHHLLKCEFFYQAPVDKKWKMLQGWKGCENCLSQFHAVTACPSKWHCRYCTKRHHSSLHPISGSSEGNPALLCTPPPSEFEAAMHSNSQQDAQVLLGTVMVDIQDARGEFQQVRGVLDSGSQSSFITQKCAHRLGLQVRSLQKKISGIGQTILEGSKGKTVCIIRPRDPSGTVQLTTEAIVVTNITSFLPATPIAQHLIRNCQKFRLADPNYWKPASIDFLIGADLFPQILTGKILAIEGCEARLFSSIFGYIIFGRVGNASDPVSSTSLFALDDSDDLNHQLKRFWDIEEPTVSSVFRDPDEEKCEVHFLQTYSRQPNGKYVVRLPFREDSPQVGDSRNVALRRFLNLEKKFSLDPNLKKAYSEIIQEHLDLGHMEPATTETKFVIPHHAIVKQEGRTLKMRIVFDASVQVREGSLNAHLLVGEKLHQEIWRIVLASRRHKIVFAADSVKMFRMIVVDERDRSYLHIFWRFDSTQDIQTLQLATLPFGLGCSPYIALRVLKQLVQDHGAEYPLAAAALEEDNYVDDIWTGAESVDQALILKQQLIDLLHKGGFALSKWASNSEEILGTIASTDVKQIITLEAKEDTWVKLLGLQWDPHEDSFLFSFQTPNEVTYTKRGILANVARLYDPLGFLTPVTFYMKSLVQELWKLNLGWDDVVPTEVQRLWDSILIELPLLSSLRIPRFVFTSGIYLSHMVGFADASTKGYAAVVYLRVFIENEWKISLLMSKSKLAPTKSLSVPRLELCGALLLAKLISALKPFQELLTPCSQPIVLHTDSSIVLGWINTPTFRLQTFVANRIAAIHELTASATWRHVSSEENPCDTASRGLLPSQFVRDQLWWHGPPWLSYHQEKWPTPTFTVVPDLPELKATTTSFMVSHQVSPTMDWIKRFSNFLKLIRSASWIHRWIYNCRHVGCCCCPLRTGPLCKADMDGGWELCIRLVQANYLLCGQPFTVLAEKYATLKPFIDHKGIVRVGGRLSNSNLSLSQKFPILLPKDAHFTALMVDHFHRIYLHPGPNLLQAIIQHTYWVPSLRRLIRKRGFYCLTCYKSKAAVMSPIMADLPSYRVNGGRAFLHVGVDLAGPFQVRESLRRKAPISKVYLTLFVCMATKALHLEIATRMSTDAFIAALERFTSRRGLPSDIYSDRGRNFVGANHYFKELHTWFCSVKTRDQLQRYAADQSITWHFNPPYTPHMGGIWEAGVKSVKGHLRKVIGESILTLEELTTLFYKIEAILNSRPLCPLSSSPEECSYLSPGHFLVGGALVELPQPSFLPIRENLLDRWQLVYAMGQRFWQRWHAEYLNCLQRRPNCKKDSREIRNGDLVLIKTDDTLPMTWPTARIVKLHPGKDGVVRVATLRTATGATYTRPVVKLVPLLPLASSPFPDP